MELKEVFEPIINFIKNFQKKDNETSKNKAKERLQLVLMQDRASVSPDFFEMMKKEIIEVIKKYIEIDEELLEVQLTRGFEDGLEGPALYANIPIKNIKPVAKKVEPKKEEIVEETAPKIEEVKEAIKEEVKEIVEEVTQKVTEETETIKEEATNVTEEAIEKVEEVKENIEEKIQEVKEDAETKKEEVAEVIEEAKEKVAKTVKKTTSGPKKKATTTKKTTTQK